MLRTLKIFANFCEAGGSHIDNWMAVTKKDFIHFRCSGACMHATESDDTIAPFTVPATFSKSSFTAGGCKVISGLLMGRLPCSMS